MPPKRKDFLKAGSKSKAKVQEPQSENDFLEAADEFEASAGKWRAGDLDKAIRFFNRAIDVYNVGLRRYPQSFDLAYNKANLEYNMCEDERVVEALGDRTKLLEETLASHRVATELDPENTDALFNTGQVLTSLAEALLENRTQEDSKVSASALLEEAVDIFSGCLASQQKEYEETQAEIARMTALQAYESSEAGQGHDAAFRSEEYAPMDTSSNSSEAAGEWATVVEPLTLETILETCSAQLGALTTLLGLYDPANASSMWVRAQYGIDTAQRIIPHLLTLIQQSPPTKPAEEPTAGPTLSLSSSSAPEESTTPSDDAILATANFNTSISECYYRSNQITSVQYASQVEAIFTPLLQDQNHSNGTSTSTPTSSVNIRAAYADALMDLASAIADNSQFSNTSSSPTSTTDLETQWTALTEAQNILTALSSGPSLQRLSPSRLADIFLARGDAELFRFRIAQLEGAKPAWTKSKGVLVGNAGVYYRGARSYAEKAGLKEVRRTADAKAGVAEALKEGLGGKQVDGERRGWKDMGAKIGEVVRQMVDEGIVGRSEAEGLST